MAARTPPARAGRREWLGLGVIALPCLFYSMDLTVLNLAVPRLAADLRPSSAQLLWIIDIYGFLVAGSLITMGTLGDRIGRAGPGDEQQDEPRAADRDRVVREDTPQSLIVRAAVVASQGRGRGIDVPVRAGDLHEAELADVAAHGRLRDREALPAEKRDELVLRAHGLLLDEAQDGTLSIALRGAGHTEPA